MKKKSTIAIISLIVLLTIIVVASYSFFAMGNLSINNAVNINILTDENNMVFDVIGGQLSLSFNASDLKVNNVGNVVANNTATLTVNFQPNTSNNVVCTYDIVYEWTSTDTYETHSPGATGNEFTVQATFSYNSHVSEGSNKIGSEYDFANLTWTNSSAIVVKNAQIDGSGSATSTATWTIATKFYNANGDQSSLAGKTLSGKFNVANVRCSLGTRTPLLKEYIVYEAPRSGTDAVSSSSWILTEDHPNEYRYAGKNPDNYIQFNGELWRIIGVMPNMEYCTGPELSTTECDTTSTGSLVKIIRNQSISSSLLRWDYKETDVGSSNYFYGSSDWSDSQLMLMLNGVNYLKTGYDANGNRLHQDYTITNNVIADSNGYKFYNATYSYLDGNGQTVYIPSQAMKVGYVGGSGSVYKKIESSSLDQITTVKWDLYGTNSISTAAEGSPSAYYNKERNINGLGAVYSDASLPENRTVYWYGKVGLMYPSDYGYATNGGSTYDRNVCLGKEMFNWKSESYKTDCALNSYLLFQNITSTAPETNGTSQWTISPYSSTSYFVVVLAGDGSVTSSVGVNTDAVRPVLYLKTDTLFSGGTGTWNDPYTIS